METLRPSILSPLLRALLADSRVSKDAIAWGPRCLDEWKFLDLIHLTALRASLLRPDASSTPQSAGMSCSAKEMGTNSTTIL